MLSSTSFAFLSTTFPDTQAVCPGELTKYQFTLFNDKTVEEQYKLSATDDLKLSETNFVILPGSSKIIYGYVQAPKEAGNYNLKLKSETKTTIETTEMILKVNPCYDYSVISEKTSYTLCEHSTLVIPFTIQNKGTIANSFQVSEENLDFSKVSRMPLTISAGTTEKFYVMVSPDYNQIGEYQLNVNTVPYYGEAIANTKVNVTVRKCYDSNLTLSEPYFELCPGDTAKQTAEITNLGEFKEEYYIGKSKYNWLLFEGNVSPLTLNPLQKETLILTIAPNQNTRPGIYELGVGAKQVSNPVETESLFKVGVISNDRCFSTLFSTSNNNIKLYANTSKEIYVDLKNNGLKTETYSFSLEGTASLFSSLSQKTLMIAPDELKEVVIFIKPNNETVLGLNTLTLNINSEHYSYSKTYKINITENLEDIGQEYTERGFFDKIGLALYSIFVIESSVEEPTVWTRIEDYKYHLIALVIIIFLVIVLISKLVSRKKKVHHEPRIRVTRKK